MYHSSSVDVSVDHKSAARTAVNPFRKRFRNAFAALAALLACSSRIDLDQRPSRPLALVFELVQERAPGDVGERPSEAAASRTCSTESFHLLWNEVFDRDQVVAFDERLGDAVQEVLAGSRESQVCLCEQGDGLLPSLTPLLPSRDGLVETTELALGFREEFLRWDHVAVARGDDARHAEVYTDRTTCLGQRCWIEALEDDDGVVAVRGSLDGESFGFAWKFAVRLPANLSDARDGYEGFGNGKIPEPERVERSFVLESRVTRSLAIFHTSKERAEGEIKAQDRIGRRIRADEFSEIRPYLPQFFDLSLLVEAPHRDLCDLPCLLPFLERGVVQLAVKVQGLLNPVDLGLCRVEAECQGLANHASSVAPGGREV